jgi:hypothetical protein
MGSAGLGVQYHSTTTPLQQLYDLQSVEEEEVYEKERPNEVRDIPERRVSAEVCEDDGPWHASSGTAKRERPPVDIPWNASSVGRLCGGSSAEEARRG